MRIMFIRLRLPRPRPVGFNMGLGDTRILLAKELVGIERIGHPALRIQPFCRARRIRVPMPILLGGER